jgi:hypothetical protein
VNAGIAGPASNTYAKVTGNYWDIRASYDIRCPEIEEQWRPEGDPSLTLDMYLETRNGKQQMYGIFHFRVVEGIMRFEKPMLVRMTMKSENSLEPSKKRKREDPDEDGHIKMNLYPSYKGYLEATEKYSENVFFLGSKDKPTAGSLGSAISQVSKCSQDLMAAMSIRSEMGQSQLSCI